MNRRLLAYFLLDTSGSMNGEPIEALNNGFNGLISMLRADPQAMDTLHLSIITFDREVKNIVPLIKSRRSLNGGFLSQQTQIYLSKPAKHVYLTTI